MLSNNTTLPELPAWRARSFWLTLLSALALIASAAGIDIFAIFGGMGLGSTPEQVVGTGEHVISAAQVLIGLGLQIWAYFERRAPNFRLVMPKWGPKIDIVGLWLALAFGLSIALSPGLGLAEQLRCQGHAKMMAELSRKYGEQALWSGLRPNGSLLTIFGNPDGSSWTALVQWPDGSSCPLIAGSTWIAETPEAPGEDG